MTDDRVVSRDVEGTRTAEESAPVGSQRITWGPIWAGFVVALATYLLLEVMLFASGARELEVDAPVDEDAALTVLIAVVAFFVGGLVAGTTMRWTAPMEGALHGTLVWATTLVAFLTLSVVGAGLSLGGLGTAAGEIGVDINELAEEGGDQFNAEQVTDDAQDAARVGLVAAVLMLGAAAGGGAVGSRVGAERRARRYRVVTSAAPVH